MRTRMEIGTILWFDARKGIGCLAVLNNDTERQPTGKRVFFHRANSAHYYYTPDGRIYLGGHNRSIQSAALYKGRRLVFSTTSIDLGITVLAWAMYDGLMERIDHLEWHDDDVRLLDQTGTAYYGIERMSAQFPKGINGDVTFEYFDREEVCFEFDPESWQEIPYSSGGTNEWLSDSCDPRLEPCCVMPAIWDLFGPYGVPQPECSHRR